MDDRTEADRSVNVCMCVDVYDSASIYKREGKHDDDLQMMLLPLVMSHPILNSSYLYSVLSCPGDCRDHRNGKDLCGQSEHRHRRVRTSLPTHLPTYLPTYLLTYLPTYLQLHRASQNQVFANSR